MLILTRRPGEQVYLHTQDGEEIRVRVQQVKGNQVRLGFDASENVKINREEVIDRIKKEEILQNPQRGKIKEVRENIASL